MMKRYEIVDHKPHLLGGGWSYKENPEGSWCHFTDHQAEIAKRDELLRRALHFMAQKTLRSEFDINLFADLMRQDLAQKDSTQ